MQKNSTDLKRYDALVSAICAADKIALFTHINMDGDAAGSAAALCLALRKLGKKAEVIIEDAMPVYLSFLEDPENSIFVNDPGFDAELSCAVDIGEKHRLENRIDTFYNAKSFICIDHHNGAPDVADTYVSDASAAASAVLVCELIEALEISFNRDLFDSRIAEALYVGILTDTGCFKFSNADKKALETTAFLLDYEFDHAAVCSRIYDSFPLAQLKLESLAFQNAEIFAQGKAVITAVLISHLDACGAKPEHAETCIDAIRCIEGTEIAVVIKEKENGVFKISLRSKDAANVSGIAKLFGGGGHDKAAGATFTGSLAELYPRLKSAVIDELKRSGCL